jgi:hypothetical protein
MSWSLTIGRFGATTVRVHLTFFLLLAWIGVSAWQKGGLPAARDGLRVECGSDRADTLGQRADKKLARRVEVTGESVNPLSIRRGNFLGMDQRHRVDAVTHGLFMAGSAEVIADPAIDRFVVSDAVPAFRLGPGAPHARIDTIPAGPLPAETIRRLHIGESLTDLLVF